MRVTHRDTKLNRHGLLRLDPSGTGHANRERIEREHQRELDAKSDQILREQEEATTNRSSQSTYHRRRP